MKVIKRIELPTLLDNEIALIVDDLTVVKKFSNEDIRSYSLKEWDRIPLDFRKELLDITPQVLGMVNEGIDNIEIPSNDWELLEPLIGVPPGDYVALENAFNLGDYKVWCFGYAVDGVNFAYILVTVESDSVKLGSDSTIYDWKTEAPVFSSGELFIQIWGVSK